MIKNKVLLLVGSPRIENSTSNAVGQYLLEKFISLGYDAQTCYIYKALKCEASITELIENFNSSDLILFAYPLYVDTLPASCIQALELITKERNKLKPNKLQKLLAVSNCGFYEKEQIENSINVCKFFAKENNLEWQGGLCIGGGAQIDGKKLESLGGMTLKLRKCLDKTAFSICNGVILSKELTNNIGFPPEPKFLYFMLANMSFKKGLKKNSKV